MELIKVICRKAAENTTAVMPGYTHLQRAQPITFGHALMAYASMLLRDLQRFEDATARMDAQCPLGSGALAGTTYRWIVSSPPKSWLCRTLCQQPGRRF